MGKAVILSALCVALTACTSRPVEPYDPAKSVYQADWGAKAGYFIFAKVRPVKIKTTPEDIKRAQFAADLKRGSNLIYWGILAAVVCIVLHGATSSQHIVAGKFSKLFEWGIVGGVMMVIAGAWYKQTVENEVVIAIVAFIAAGFFLSRERVKKWSLSHGFKWFAGLFRKQAPQIPSNE